VTPSYNQAEFLEETIRSILLQGYPNLEYIIIDDGSHDHSAAIIRKYERWLAYWSVQENRGQSQAINRGLAQATGDIMGLVNSDDFYLQGTLADVAIRLSRGDGFIAGGFVYVDAQSQPLERIYASIESGPWFACPVKNMAIKRFRLPYPTMFWTREVYLKAKPLAEDLLYNMDLDFILRVMAAGITPQVCDSVWTGFRQHKNSKSLSRSPLFNLEAAKVYWRFSLQPQFRFWPCLREACRNVAYYCRKRAQLAMNQRSFLRATAWSAASVLAFPCWQMTRSNLGCFVHSYRAGARNCIESSDQEARQNSEGSKPTPHIQRGKICDPK
jgi:glycosyltransferase involved in cell wall biosynthesis